MINRIKAGILWAKAVREVENGNGAAGRQLIEKMAQLVDLKPYHVVMLAHAEIRDGDDPKAAFHLNDALEMMSDKDSPNARYLKLHIRAILNLMEGKRYDDLAREGAKIACTPRLKRWFPLRGGE